MSTLLVLNSSSKIAQSFIRALHSSQTFDQIICADLYLNYTAIQNFLHFKQSLPQNRTKIEDAKFVDRQDIQDLAQRANNLLFVTHDYYMVAPHKIDMLTNALSLSPFGKYQKLVYVAPVELDHALEEDSTSKWIEAETNIKKTHQNLISVRSDVTFGPDSSIAHKLLTRIFNEQSVYFKPLGSSPAPISSQDLATIVTQLFLDDKNAGKSFLAQGPRPIDWNTYIKTLDQSVGLNYKAILNQNQLENIISPTSDNILSEFLYDSQYRNLTQFIQNLRNIPATGYENANILLKEKQIDFEEYYSKNPSKKDQYVSSLGFIEKVLL